MDQLIREELQSHIEHYKCNFIILPIKSIDSIDCCVKILTNECNDKPCYVMKITSNKDCEADEDGDMSEHVYWGEKIELNQIKETLQSLKYNHFDGRFQKNEIIDWSFLENDKIKLRYEECCVCHEKISSKTNCGHSLCVPCYDKIKSKEGMTACPCCRQYCHFKE